MNIQILKRNGETVNFVPTKIEVAVKKANDEVGKLHQLSDYQINEVVNSVTKIVEQTDEKTDVPVSVEDIQDMVEEAIMEVRGYEVAQKYIRYRYLRELSRQGQELNNKIGTIVDQGIATDEQDEFGNEIKGENSNKNPQIVSTQRDYMAGEVSKDFTKRILLPADIVKAHDEAIIHFHDMDYFAQREHNCDLINLEDMLQNGTVISETLIEKPHSFYTACNVTTQIVAQVASSQYGGQSFSLAHISPFVEVSRKHYREEVRNELTGLGTFSDDDINRIAENRVRDEIKRGIQTIQYQLITLMTCNGQAPFVTMYLNLFEAPEGRERDDLALCIEEVFKQRMQGVKNEQGVWITPAFPQKWGLHMGENLVNLKYRVSA